MRSKTLDCGSLLPLAVGSPAAGEVSTHGKADWLSPGRSLSVITLSFGLPASRLATTSGSRLPQSGDLSLTHYELDLATH